MRKVRSLVLVTLLAFGAFGAFAETNWLKTEGKDEFGFPTGKDVLGAYVKGDGDCTISGEEASALFSFATPGGFCVQLYRNGDINTPLGVPSVDVNKCTCTAYLYIPKPDGSFLRQGNGPYPLVYISGMFMNTDFPWDELFKAAEANGVDKLYFSIHNTHANARHTIVLDLAACPYIEGLKDRLCAVTTIKHLGTVKINGNGEVLEDTRGLE